MGSGISLSPQLAVLTHPQKLATEVFAMETASSLVTLLCGLAILTAWTAPQTASSMRLRYLKLLSGLGLFAFVLSCISPYDDALQREWIRPAASQAQPVPPNSHALPGKVPGTSLYTFPLLPVQTNVLQFANASICLTHPGDQRSVIPAPIHSPPLLL